MSVAFEELSRCATPMGVVSLRRRFDPVIEAEVYEARLDDEFLMSSQFTVAEEALATRVLAEVPGDELVIAVAGLGLGYTVRAALGDARVRSVDVVEALSAVIGWHTGNVIPDTRGLASDARVQLIEGDFFAMVRAGAPFASGVEGYDAILVDIDHSPRHVLHSSHGEFYTVRGLGAVSARLRDGGALGLWSDDPPDREFMDVFEEVFRASAAHVVQFPNPYTGGESSNTVYVGTASGHID